MNHTTRVLISTNDFNFRSSLTHGWNTIDGKRWEKYPLYHAAAIKAFAALESLHWTMNDVQLVGKPIKKGKIRIIKEWPTPEKYDLGVQITLLVFPGISSQEHQAIQNAIDPTMQHSVCRIRPMNSRQWLILHISVEGASHV